MAKERFRSVLLYIRKLAGSQAADVTDRHLLERFASDREEEAFALLVERHGPMVLSVCRRVLGNMQDAEDAFQATFLILSRKAAARIWHDSVGSWLFEVAYRTAQKEKTAAVRRRAREQKAAAMRPAESSKGVSGTEMRDLLDGEMQRLPEKYRAPLVLCCLEGKTIDESALLLGKPKGTVQSRLARAREMLRERLTRRGCVVTVASLAAALAAEPLSAAVPVALAETTIKAAMLFAAGQAMTAGAISAKAVTLAEGVLHTMFMTKMKIIAAVMLTLCVIAPGSVMMTYRALAEKPQLAQGDQPAEKKKGPMAKSEPAAEKGKPTLTDVFGDPLPKGAIARMGTVRFRNGHWIDSIAYSPDGKTLATGNDDKTIRIWDAATGKEIRVFKGHESDVLSIAFSPDGKTLASAGADHALRLWDAATGKEIRVFNNLEGEIALAAFSTDGKTLATAGKGEAAIQLWDTSTGKEILVINKEIKGKVSSLAFSSDGKTLASATGGKDEQTIQLWDAATGKKRLVMKKALKGEVSSLVFSPMARPWLRRATRMQSSDCGTRPLARKSTTSMAMKAISSSSLSHFLPTARSWHQEVMM